MVITKEIFDDITRDDMPNNSMREIWDDFGKEVAIKMLSEYGGLPITPPKRGFIRYANRKIREERNSENVRYLMRKYNVSLSYVYSVNRNLKPRDDK